MTTLKEEWKERLKKIEQRNIFPKDGGYFTVMTDFYQAPDEIRYDKEMCLKVLLEANECIWNIPKEIRTNEFLEEIVEKGYKGNILESKKYWDEEDFLFLKKHLAKFEKNNKPKFSTWLLGEPQGIFANREMLLSLIKDDNYDNTDFLLRHYKKDKEILCALLDNKPNDIDDMPKSIKNAYCKNIENVYKLLNHNKSLYQFLPEKIQSMQEIIEYQLINEQQVFYFLPQSVIDDRKRIFDLIKKFPHVKGNEIPSEYRNDFEIATFLIKRDGRNFSAFDFKGNDDLIKLATQTYNNVSYIPNKDEYGELIKEVTLKSSLKENNESYAPYKGNTIKMKYIKNLFHSLIIENKIGINEVAEFFNLKMQLEKESISNIVLEKPLLLELIHDFPSIYEKLHEYEVQDRFDITHAYVESCKRKQKDYTKTMSFKIKAESSKLGMEIDKYVLSQYLSQKLPEVPKSKVNKI